MDDLELCKIIDDNISSGIGADGSELSSVRQDIYDRYLGELYGDEKAGRSKVTTRELFETVEWAMPAIMEVFEASERIVDFRPEGPEDEAQAEQESDAVNYVYNKDNNGFITTHHIVKSALMNPNAYVEVLRDESTEVVTEEYQGITDIELALLTQDQDIELTGADILPNGLFNIEIKRTNRRGRNNVECVPEDEIIVSKDHGELSLEKAEFVCREVELTHSDLLKLDYDEYRLDQVWSTKEEKTEKRNRRKYSDEQDHSAETHKALRKYTVQRCSMLVDYDDDGIAERRFVVKIGNEIFENDQISYQPYESAATILIPHRHVQYSLAQSVLDLQQIKTYFTRQLVNNMSRVNDPRTFINEDVRLDDALSNKMLGYVRIEGRGDVRAAVSSDPTQPIIGQALPLLQLFDDMKENRSGITRNSQGLDADILAKSTEGAFMGALEKAEGRIGMICRILAETVFTSVMLKIHHLLLTHGDIKQMRSNGEWVPVNPQEWRKRENMTVNVGLGRGSKRQRMMAASMIIDRQDKDIAMGGMGTLVSPQNLYNARKLQIESAGEKNVDKYYMNPQLAPPKKPQPPKIDPNIAMIQSNERIEQGKRQVEMAKARQDAQINAAKIHLEQVKSQRADQWKQVELAYKKQADTIKNTLDQQKNQDTADAKALQARLDQLELDLKDKQHEEKLAMDQYEADLMAKVKLAIEGMKGDNL